MASDGKRRSAGPGGEAAPGGAADGPSSPVPLTGRIVAIDIVRGFAILWVILYHLWSDVQYPDILSASETFQAVPEGLAGGSLTAVSDAFLRVGYLGVPLFMVLSGLSLTLVAMRRETVLTDAPRFLYQRLRRVMIPYWVGFAYTLLFLAGLAFVQWQRGGKLAEGAGVAGTPGYVDYFLHGDQTIDWGQIWAGLLMVPRMFKNEWQFAPEGSLWFVLVIVQYYLLFPLLFPLMKRIGPWTFAAGALAITLAFRWAAIDIDGNFLVSRHLVETAAPFRIFEFALGMAMGSFIAGRGRRALPGAAAIVFSGLLLFISGNLIDPLGGETAVLIDPMVALGMALIVLPLIVKIPGALEVSAPGRVLAWVGVISYTVLIINEPLRAVTHTLRNEDAPWAWQALWIGVLYMPITLIAARPLAVLLGLVERERPPDGPAATGASATEAPSLQA